MAIGDLYIKDGRNLFKRAADGGLWSLVNTGGLNLSRGLTVSVDGSRIYAALGSRISTYDGSSWTNVTVTIGEVLSITGIAIDGDGVIFLARGRGNIFKYDPDNSNPTLSVANPNDSILQPANARGFSINQKNGEMAITDRYRIWTLEKGGSAWSEVTIPTTVISNGNRYFESLTYDSEGYIWVYNTTDYKFYNQKSDGTWASNLTLPTTIGSHTLGRSSLGASAFEQGADSGVELVAFGTDIIDGLKVGNTDVDAVYLGTEKLYG